MLPVDIANSALTHCGSDAVLVNIDDDSKAGRLCTQNYDLARRAVLAKQPWKFAIKRVQVDLDTAETPAFGFSSRFQVPDDYIRAICVNDRYTDWVREGRYILCNEAGPINLRYVSDEESVELFDPLFADAIAYDLALRICYALTQSSERVEGIKQEYSTVISKARFADSIEKSMTTTTADVYTDSRLQLASSNLRPPPGG